MDDAPLLTLSLSGLQEILNNQTLLNLIDSFTVDDAAREQIRQIGGQNKDYDNHDFFCLKTNRFTYCPHGELADVIAARQYDDLLVKWFLLLYSIASVNKIYDTYIYRFADERIKKLWLCPDTFINLHKWSDELDHLLDGLIDLDSLVKTKLGLSGHMWQECRQGIILFCLSAGFRWKTRRDFVSIDLYQRNVGMPMILSIAYYISAMTGEDFYDSLRNLLETNGKKGALDDILVMVKTTKEKQCLITEQQQILAQLRLKEEAIRKQETALDIICESYGSKVSEDELNKRISRCNKESSREILYNAESILGHKLSYTDKIATIDQTDRLISNIPNKYGIILSHREVESIITVEDLINTVNDHRCFIAQFGAALYDSNPFEYTDCNEQYDLNTKAKEITQQYGEDIDFSNIQSVNDIRLAVLNRYSILDDLKQIVLDVLNVDPSELHDNASLAGDLGADSLDLVEIIMEIEKKLDIEISDEEAAEKISTVGDARRLIYEKLREKAENINR